MSIRKPSAKAAIYGVRISVRQETTLTSPEDGKTHKTTSIHPFVQMGLVPPPDMAHPHQSFPALWRGIEAGGEEDEVGWEVEIKTRFPASWISRCSTPPG